MPDISDKLNNSVFCYGYGADECYTPLNFADVSAPSAMCLLNNLCATAQPVTEVLKIMALYEDIILVQSLAYMDAWFKNDTTFWVNGFAYSPIAHVSNATPSDVNATLAEI